LGGFDLVIFEGKRQFVGILHGGTELQWVCDPGEHLVLSWSQDGQLKGGSGRVSFMKANVEANKVYDVVADVSPGFFTAPNVMLTPLAQGNKRRERVEEFERRERVVLRGLQDTEEVRNYTQRSQPKIEKIYKDFLEGSKTNRVVSLQREDSR
jgi:hypothetical protein